MSTKALSTRILISDPLDQSGIEMLRGQGNVDIKIDITPNQLMNSIYEYDAFVVRSATKINAEAIDHPKSLKAIGHADVGLDNLALEKAKRKGIGVSL